jgi:plastocyanin
MKKLLLVPLALLAALVVAGGASADTKTVQITKSGFTPASSSIQLGDTVTWRNSDTATHQVVADDGTFASPVLKTGETYSFTFQKTGRTAYHDEFAKTRKGSVTVTGSPASVTLNPSATTIVYGANVALNGQTSGQITNEPVTLTSQPFGKGTQSVATTTTTANGAFGFAVAPSIQTSYQAHWRTGNSPNVTVNVAPRVGFGRIGTRYTVKVTSDLSYGGRYVMVQRKGPFGSWTNVKRVFLNDSSRAAFTLRLVKGRSSLRVFLPAGQAGAGYVQSLSRTLGVTTVVKKNR